MTETPSQHYCHLQDGDTLSLVVAPIYITLSICAIIGNTFVIASVVLFSNLRTPTNNFVVALALADLTVRCVIVIILFHPIIQSSKLHFCKCSVNV